MSRKKTWVVLTGSVLAAGALLGSLGQSASTSSYGNVLAMASVTVVEEGQEMVVLTQPTQKQLNELNRLLAGNPTLTEDRHAYRKVFEVKAKGLDQQKNKADKALKRHSVSFTEELSGEEVVLDLMSYDTQNGKKFAEEPGSATPKLHKNPQVEGQFLFEKNSGLYLLDTKTMKVKPVGDHQKRVQLMKEQHAATDHNDHQHERLLYFAAQPVWSADGKQVAFVSNRDAYETDKPGLESLYVLDVATGVETKVLGGGDLAAARPFGWTADGEILLTEYRWINNAPDATLVRYNPQTKQRQETAKGEYVALSDDKATLLYTTGQGENVKLYAHSLLTGKSELLYKASNGEVLRSYMADFSADGTRVVFDVQRNDDAAQSLVVYDLTSKSEQRLTIPAGKQLTGQVVFAGDQLVVPVESLKDLTAETLLMSVN
ncbi:hypothetical protein OS242_19045 [Tumebacillus sp. DT12]|uniref:S9 family peptidase n=1 Tax=Tumebacillus lacus TaxID=2995335 RepID=A0ABT3X7R2_9BACL|nr:hypothetical protein [Tumebacillus lacus]MCX7572037.1 hypothetical protein [Tumebacillus lacus]